jgi:curved DNA-binding protein CbpA
MTTQIANPYETLGVPRTASAAEVRDAYRRLAMQFHPDLHADARATERMQRINQAWELLSIPSARARYDAQSSAPPATAYPHWNSGRRPSPQPYAAPPPYGPRPAWRSAEPNAATESWRDDDELSPLRWAFLVALLLLTFPLFVLFGAVVPLPVLGLLAFFAARILFRTRD